jgi:hypothetical protein
LYSRVHLCHRLYTCTKPIICDWEWIQNQNLWSPLLIFIHFHAVLRKKRYEIGITTTREYARDDMCGKCNVVSARLKWNINLQKLLNFVRNYWIYWVVEVAGNMWTNENEKWVCTIAPSGKIIIRQRSKLLIDHNWLRPDVDTHMYCQIMLHFPRPFNHG